MTLQVRTPNFTEFVQAAMRLKQQQKLLNQEHSGPGPDFPTVLIQFANRKQEDDLRSGKASSLTAGTFTEDAGKRKYRLRDERGFEEEFERTIVRVRSEDEQSNSTTASPSVDIASDARSNRERVADSTLSNGLRLEALRELISEDNDSAAEFVSDELAKNDLEIEWRRIVIYATESIRFAIQASRTRVALQLAQHAKDLRHSPSSDDIPVVMCAIRRAGSILPSEMVPELIDLLSHPKPIDTRLVTIQAINSMFFNEPPSDALPPELANRIFTLAEKHWDLDVFRGGEISALAIEATVAIATLVDTRINNLVQLANRTERQLLLKKLKSRLVDVKRIWERNPFTKKELECVTEAIGQIASF